MDRELMKRIKIIRNKKIEEWQNDELEVEENPEESKNDKIRAEIAIKLREIANLIEEMS